MRAQGLVGWIFRHSAWLPLPLGLVFHGVIALGLRWVCMNAYSENAWIPEKWVCPLTFALLGLGAVLSWVMNVEGLRRLFRDWGIRWVMPLVFFLVLPSALLAAFWCYTLMFLTGWA